MRRGRRKGARQRHPRQQDGAEQGSPHIQAPRDVITMLSFLRQPFTKYLTNAHQFSTYCTRMVRCSEQLLHNIEQNPLKYRCNFNALCERVTRATNTMFVSFVKDYNTMANVSNTGDDQGWNAASVLFLTISYARYLVMVCRTVERLGEMRGRRLRSPLLTPFFPLLDSDARSAFRMYVEIDPHTPTVTRDARPRDLLLRPRNLPGLLRRGLFLFHPDICIGEYTQMQVLKQLRKLAHAWHFIAMDDPDIRVLLQALMMRLHEILVHAFFDNEWVFDMEGAYRDHAVFQGLTESAESRTMEKQIVSNPDGTITYDDSDNVKLLKREYAEHGSTRKQASVRFIMETTGILRCMYKDLLFYGECIEPQLDGLDVLVENAHGALVGLVRKAGRMSTSHADYDSSASRRGQFELDNAEAPEEHIQRFISTIRVAITTTTAEMRDTSFIHRMIQRLRVTMVPYGTREVYASNNEGIMNCPKATQDQECTPTELMTRRRNVWPQMNLDYFYIKSFSPRVHARVACAIFQSILYTMDLTYTWNAREFPAQKHGGSSTTQSKSALLEPCVVYDSSRVLESHSISATDEVPRIVTVMGTFFLQYKSRFYRLKHDSVFEAIGYWLLIFAKERFSRWVGTQECVWVKLERWVLRTLSRTLSLFLKPLRDEGNGEGGGRDE